MILHHEVGSFYIVLSSMNFLCEELGTDDIVLSFVILNHDLGSGPLDYIMFSLLIIVCQEVEQMM